MPVTKQAIKKVRQDQRKTLINLKVKNAYKKAVLVFRKKPSAGGLKVVYQSLDKAAKTNVIHRNKAARLKSRLARLLRRSSTKPPVAANKSSKSKSVKR